MLNNERNPQAEDRLVIDLMYYLLLKDFQKVLNEVQILTPNEEHKTVFGEKPPITGWRKARTLKNYLVRAKINNDDTKESKIARCNGKRCQVCQYIEERCEFEFDGNKYYIRKGVINCNTDFTVYKFHCSSCSKQYIGSNITDFRYRFNNCKSAFGKISKSVKAANVNQLHFHQHFKLLECNGMDDWRLTLIDRADNRKELRKQESFWQYKLNTFFPHGLNERNVPRGYD